jgi:hypothetical protein
MHSQSGLTIFFSSSISSVASRSTFAAAATARHLVKDVLCNRKP